MPAITVDTPVTTVILTVLFIVSSTVLLITATGTELQLLPLLPRIYSGPLVA